MAISKLTNPVLFLWTKGQWAEAMQQSRTEILNEYEEKLTEFYNPQTADFILTVLCTATNVIFAEPHFIWNLITIDPDDNRNGEP